ncbi:ShlB/FhaC/HecB family hemolysin secretion/activation protein, partial [Escherichia coli]|nr:ShlB/FhaC/HecB family hemolysin secretion/activation protein [Escherichia coli]
IERADQPWPQEQPCFPIRSVLLVGQQAERFAFALQPVTGGAAPALGRCLGGEGVALLASRVQNAIVDRGYVTTRVLVEPQDLKS